MDEIIRWWPIIVAFVASVFWLSRLEWRGLQNSSEIKRLWAQRKEDLESAQRARDETNKILDEIRTDIKELLKKGTS